jgi:hypothetical protein
MVNKKRRIINYFCGMSRVKPKKVLKLVEEPDYKEIDFVKDDFMIDFEEKPKECSIEELMKIYSSQPKSKSESESDSESESESEVEEIDDFVLDLIPNLEIDFEPTIKMNIEKSKTIIKPSGTVDKTGNIETTGTIETIEKVEKKVMSGRYEDNPYKYSEELYKKIGRAHV